MNRRMLTASDEDKTRTAPAVKDWEEWWRNARTVPITEDQRINGNCIHFSCGALGQIQLNSIYVREDYVKIYDIIFGSSEESKDASDDQTTPTTAPSTPRDHIATTGSNPSTSSAAQPQLLPQSYILTGTPGKQRARDFR